MESKLELRQLLLSRYKKEISHEQLIDAVYKKIFIDARLSSQIDSVWGKGAAKRMVNDYKDRKYPNFDIIDLIIQ